MASDINDGISILCKLFWDQMVKTPLQELGIIKYHTLCTYESLRFYALFAKTEWKNGFVFLYYLHYMNMQYDFKTWPENSVIENTMLTNAI